MHKSLEELKILHSEHFFNLHINSSSAIIVESTISMLLLHV